MNTSRYLCLNVTSVWQSSGRVVNASLRSVIRRRLHPAYFFPLSRFAGSFLIHCPSAAAGFCVQVTKASGLQVACSMGLHVRAGGIVWLRVAWGMGGMEGGGAKRTERD